MESNIYQLLEDLIIKLALMLLSSAKFKSKAEEVVKDGLEKPVRHEIIPKISAGSDAPGKPQLKSEEDVNIGGMMLYTSGTTSRPVWKPLTPWLLTLIPW